MDNTDLTALLSSDEVFMCQEVSVPSGTTTPKRVTKPRARPVSTKQQPLPEGHSLRGVVEFVILLGLNSVNLWEKTLYDIRRGVSDLMNTEVTNLYFNLKKVSKAICSGVSLSSDLSQYKLEEINADERDFTELLDYAAAVLDADSKSRYTTESVKVMYDLIGKAVDQANKPNELTTSNDREEDNKSCDDDFGEEDDEIFNLFGRGLGKKSKSVPPIKQLVSVRSGDVVRKCSSPGEVGKIMVKIEITCCDDLKGVSPARHWTKVLKKAVFLAKDEKDESFRAIHEVWSKQAKIINKIKDSVTEESEVFKEDESPRKRAKF